MLVRLSVLAILLCYGGAVDAYGSLRCKGRIIDPGASMAYVLSLCGTPDDRITEQVPTRARVLSGFTRLIGYTTAERWVYDRGWGKFPAVLVFQEGVIQRIDYLPYRSGDE